MLLRCVLESSARLGALRLFEASNLIFRQSDDFRVETVISYLFPVFCRGHIECGKRHSMKLSSAALALVASLLVIGCAKEPPPTAAESALEEER